MLSLKHFAQLIVIILLLSVMFLYLNVNNRTQVSKDSVNAPLLLPEETEEGLTPSGEGAWEDRTHTAEEDRASAVYSVVYSGGDETEEKIYDNVCRYLTHMRLPFRTVAYVTKGDLSPGVTLIFCHTQVSQCMEAETLGSYIEQGGRALFAAGMPEGYADSYLSPLWGVVEKGGRMESTVWKLHEGFLPAREQTVKSPDFEASTRVKLNQDAQVWLEDEENQIPVVYGFSYGKGESVMINSTLMQGRYSGGVFAASLGALKGELVYPVIGTLTVFLEDFPFLLPGYDRNCIKYYGRSMESFERDMLWPSLLSFARSRGVKYTMNLKERPDVSGEEQLNERLLSFLVKENLRYSGEIMLSGYGGSKEAGAVQRLFQRHFPSYAIQAFARLPGETKPSLEESGFPSAEASLPEEKTPFFPIQRGGYEAVEAGETTARVEAQDFDYDRGQVYFPVMSRGFSLEEASYRYLAGVGLYGVVSHGLPMAQLITATSAAESYEGVKTELGELLTELGRAADWLTPATVTEAAGETAFYDRLTLRTSYSEEAIRISCGQFKKGQKLLLRTQSRPSGITGGTLKEVGPNYYCVEVQEAQITIALEQEGARP